VEWIGGHTPTAYFKDEEGNQLEEVVLGDFNHEEMLNFFVLHGLTPKKPQVDWKDPTKYWDFQGHHYEFFDVKAQYHDAKDFALSRQHNDLSGYPLTLTSPEEEMNVIKQLWDENKNEEVTVWLGTEDPEEGTWKWAAGPEEGTTFWQGKGTQGSAMDGHYNHWREHEPNNANDVNEEDCATLNVFKNQGLWNDVPCRWKNGVIVEYGENAIENIVCTMDVHECPDGSFVSRNPWNECNWNPCAAKEQSTDQPKHEDL